jgi:hypothetical protein
MHWTGPFPPGWGRDQSVEDEWLATTRGLLDGANDPLHGAVAYSQFPRDGSHAACLAP